MMTRNTTAVVVLLTASLGGAAAAQQAGRGPRLPQPLPFAAHAGFASIFDGSTLKGWDGDS
jgi:hypothetical protein